MFHKIYCICLVISVVVGCNNDRDLDYSVQRTSSDKVTSASDKAASNQSQSKPDDPPTRSTAGSMTQSSRSDGSTVQAQYVWKRDMYQESDLFRGCAFPEKSDSSIRDKGSELTELFYLRSVIKEKFHWGNELTDLDPNGYLKKPANFEQHLTNMKGENGYYADFLRTSRSFSEDPIPDKYLSVLSDEELEMEKRVLNSASFGINWSISEAKEGKGLFVRYKEGRGWQFDRLKNIERGDRLISVNDTNVEILLSAGDFKTLYQLLYPIKIGSIGKFVFESRESKTIKTVNLTSFEVQNYTINDIAHVRFAGNKKVGYLIVPKLDTDAKYGGRSPEVDFNMAFDRLKNNPKVEDLIVDFRYTSFGSLDVASQLATLIAGNYTEDRVFARHKTFSNDVSSKSNKETPFIFHCLNYWFNSCAFPDNSPGLLFYVKRIFRFRHMLHLSRVYVIVSKETCGVAEAFINALLGIDFEVILIGGNTCGNPYFGSYVGKCGVKYNIPEYQVLNEKNFGGYEKGFRPSNAKHLPGIPVKGCFAEENDFSHPWRSTSDPYIAAALQYRKDGTCAPIPSDLKGSDDQSNR